MNPYSVILTNVGACSDRFLPDGYSPSPTLEELFERLSRVPGVTGTELISDAVVRDDNRSQVKTLLKQFGLQVSSIIPDHFGRSGWGRGAFTAPDEAVRRAAIRETCAMIDFAREVGCGVINIWNGQDGFDYPLQADYNALHAALAEGIRSCADYGPEIKIALEYKLKEPRTHSLVSTMDATLRLVDKIGRPNVGVTIDTGHALAAGENMAQAACAALRDDRLFHLHLNDNYRSWDDDMIVGSVHTIEYLELFYWLKQMRYAGWLSIDQYPYREESVAAVSASIAWLDRLVRTAAGLDPDLVAAVLRRQDAVAATNLLRQAIFGG
jgi:xylose isomerase